MKIPELIYSTATNTCPRCHKGKVFTNRNPYNLAHAFEMNAQCPHCELKYEREPGFFYGALYVSYALMSGTFIVWFVSDQVWLHLDTLTLLALVIGTMALFFPVAFRWSRLIWLNFFFKFDKSKREKLIVVHREKEVPHSKAM